MLVFRNGFFKLLEEFLDLLGLSSETIPPRLSPVSVLMLKI